MIGGSSAGDGLNGSCEKFAHVLALKGLEVDRGPAVLGPACGEAYEVGILVQKGMLFLEGNLERDGAVIFEVGDDLAGCAIVDSAVMRSQREPARRAESHEPIIESRIAFSWAHVDQALWTEAIRRG